MKLEDLAAEVRRMRDLQRKFFKGDRSSATLEASKTQERRVDRMGSRGVRHRGQAWQALPDVQREHHGGRMRHDAAILKMAEERGGKILKAQYAIADRERPGIQLISQSTDGRSAPHVSVLVIPDWLPVSVNKVARAKMRKGMRIAGGVRQVIAAEVHKARLPRATTARRVLIEVTFPNLSMAPDPDNLAKLMLDALKDAGMLIDDRVARRPQVRRRDAMTITLTPEEAISALNDAIATVRELRAEAERLREVVEAASDPVFVKAARECRDICEDAILAMRGCPGCNNPDCDCDHPRWVPPVPHDPAIDAEIAAIDRFLAAIRAFQLIPQSTDFSEQPA
jgi:hypothetical protein